MVSVSNVWDRSIEFINDHLGALLPVAIFAIFVPTSISGALGNAGPAVPPTIALLVSIASLAFALLQLWGQLAIVAHVLEPAPGARAGRRALRRLPVAIGVLIVLGLATLAAMVPLLSLMVMGGVDLTRFNGGTVTMPAMPTGYGTAALIYALALLVVIAVFAARLIVVMPVVVGEREGVRSIGRAFALTRGLTLRLIGILILYAVVTFVATLAARTVFGSILGLIAGGDGPFSVASVVSAVAVAAVTTAMVVLASVFSTTLYLAIAGRRDAVAAGFA